jgi:hypothetical protein
MNNSLKFFKELNKLTETLSIQSLLPQSEGEATLDIKYLSTYFQKLGDISQDNLLTQITQNPLLQTELKKAFLDLNMKTLLNNAFSILEPYLTKLENNNQRFLWLNFLELIVVGLIQSLLRSSQGIKAGSVGAVREKLDSDKSFIKEAFEEVLSERAMQSSLEIISDVERFFDSSPDFIAMVAEKIRKTHGSGFTINMVKALLNLRTDFSKDERIEVFQACKDIFSQLLKEESMNQKESLFKRIDTQVEGEIIKGFL